MKIFSSLYLKVIQWSKHRQAIYFLAGLSFAESSFFPVPPDVMLVSMGIAKPQSVWRYAFITTVFSILGGIFGYILGMYAMHIIQPWLTHSSYQHSYEHVVSWFNNYGIWVIFFAGFSPVPPYKIFTLAAGILKMPFLPFVIASWLGRGLRFYLVATVLFFFGENLHKQMEIYVDRLALLFLLLLSAVLFIFKYIF